MKAGLKEFQSAAMKALPRAVMRAVQTVVLWVVLRAAGLVGRWAVCWDQK
jgi:hypothetical protein